MKNLFMIVGLAAAGNFYAQVAIGKTSVDGSAILDFAENTNKGIILPWVKDISKADHSGGTILYDEKDKKVKWFDGTGWNDLSVHAGSADTSEVDDLQENTSKAGVIIGDVMQAPVGVLSLHRSGYALVLPKNSEPWKNIPQPEPGTITYDTVNNLVCIFNGTEWTFWGK